MFLVGEAEILEEVDVWDDGDDGEEGKRFCNPVVAQDAPDPGVTWAKDAWYMVTTGQGPDGGAFDIRRSPDLVSWQAIGSIFPQGSHPKWSNNTDYWAPEIHHVNGRFNAYFTAGNEKGVLSVGVATSDKVEGPYVDAGQPLVTDPVGTIDATFFRDEDLDAQYLIWKVDANSVGKQSTIKIREVDDKGMAFVENSVEVDLIRSDLPWEGMVIEAPWMVKRNGEYYLFYSGNCYANERYGVGVARSASIYGPYKKAAAPILQQSAPDPSASVRKFAGPGHCSVVQGKRDMIMVYHAWRADKLGGAPGRMVMWTASSGAPTGGPSSGTVALQLVKRSPHSPRHRAYRDASSRAAATSFRSSASWAPATSFGSTAAGKPAEP